MSNPWFRLHSDILSDEKVMSLGFSDRWFFVGVMCLKCDGMTEKYEGTKLDRKVALRLGISLSEAEELKARLVDEELIDAAWQPCAWDKRQYKSDTSADRVRDHRAKKKQQPKQDDSTVKRSCNVTVTPPDTDTDTEVVSKNICAVSAKHAPGAFEAFWSAFPDGRKRGKGKCRDLFNRVIKTKSVTGDQLVQAVMDMRGIAPDYPPMPATWLNGGRWEDDPQPSSSKPKSNKSKQLEALAKWVNDDQPEQEMKNVTPQNGHSPAHSILSSD